MYLFLGGLQCDFFLTRELQYNLIRSHAAGVGTPLNPDKTRMLLALRINVLAKGHSGISLTTLYDLIKAFNGKQKHAASTVLTECQLPHIFIL
jgi:histidine ammonia-lyase